MFSPSWMSRPMLQFVKGSAARRNAARHAARREEGRAGRDGTGDLGITIQEPLQFPHAGYFRTWCRTYHTHTKCITYGGLVIHAG